MNNTYTLPQDVQKQLNFIARMEVHSKEFPECQWHLNITDDVKRSISDKIFKILLEQELYKFRPYDTTL